MADLSASNTYPNHISRCILTAKVDANYRKKWLLIFTPWIILCSLLKWILLEEFLFIKNLIVISNSAFQRLYYGDDNPNVGKRQTWRKYGTKITATYTKGGEIL